MLEEKTVPVNCGAMLNAYPDSMGGTLTELVHFLQEPEIRDAFRSLYILPSIFNTDLDRGFSVIDYGLNEQLANNEDLDAIKELGMDLKLDFILNHASVLSKQFQDILKNGEFSKYKDFFIDWNRFWEGSGTMTSAGYIQPNEELIKDMFFRKPGLPILMVRMPDGSDVPYWNTFYQELRYTSVDAVDLMNAADMQYSSAQALSETINSALENGAKPAEIAFGRYEKYKDKVVSLLERQRKYLGQMDLNIKSPLVWEHYDETLRALSGYGAKIVRLDAFAYAPKEPGEHNFLNEPGTWELLKKVRTLADKYGVTLLPEIHASYAEKIYEKLANEGYMTYDFFLPGLVLDALENCNGERIAAWASELYTKKIMTVNMLGCHDGIPLLDLKGLMPDEEIGRLIDVIVERGGFIKNLHGQKNVYYQVSATYYSALGEDDRKMLLARALQLFMPGKPQVWYLDVFAGKNDYDAVSKAGAGGHKEINRTNLSEERLWQELRREVVQRQLELLRIRNQCPAFGFDATMTISTPSPNLLNIQWENNGCAISLKANLSTAAFWVTGSNIPYGDIEFHQD